MDIFEGIKTRRSIRKFSSEEVSAEAIAKILEAGRWAPSGKNNQPWKFMVLDKVKKDALAEFTKYSFLVKGANKLILIFLYINAIIARVDWLGCYPCRIQTCFTSWLNFVFILNTTT